MINEMHNSYNQFYSTVFCLLYMFRTNLVIHHQEQTKNCGIKIDYKNCASRWSLTHYLDYHVGLLHVCSTLPENRTSVQKHVGILINVMNCIFLVGLSRVAQLVKKLTPFYGTQIGLPCSQQPTSCPSHEPDKSSARTPSNVLEMHFNITVQSMPWFSKSPFSPQVSVHEFSLHFSCPT